MVNNNKLGYNNNINYNNNSNNVNNNYYNKRTSTRLTTMRSKPDYVEADLL